jgi:hypothetical protein
MGAIVVDDHSTPSQARDQAVEEPRVELLSELAIHTLRPEIDPLRPRKRDIAEHLGLIVLPSGRPRRRRRRARGHGA